MIISGHNNININNENNSTSRRTTHKHEVISDTLLQSILSNQSTELVKTNFLDCFKPQLGFLCSVHFMRALSSYHLRKHS